MKFLHFAVLGAVTLMGASQAHAVRDVGDLPVKRARAASDPRAAAAPEPRAGVVTGVRAAPPRGTELEIDGRWWLVLRGRTSVLRGGRLLDESALAAGQAVRYVPASPAREERALGYVEVP